MDRLENMIALSTSKSCIHTEELPPIDLYIDQVLTLISQRAEKESLFSDERPLSKMMVNNYSKAGVIRPIKGKKYSREHIVQLLTVCSLKVTLSINEIKAVLDNLYSDEDFGAGELFGCYEKGLMAQRKCLTELTSMLQSTVSEPDSAGEQFAALMAVCAMSDALSELARRMAAEYFAPNSQKKRP